MSKEQQNKEIVARWCEGFWGAEYNPDVVEELAAPDMLLQYSLHEPRRGKGTSRRSWPTSAKRFPTSPLRGLPT